ncbi:MAG: Uma2 family endonuclease [Gemmatimonadota bacterium]|nr:Uma2 family endonuclease [Gemmatimonadota bacterium]
MPATHYFTAADLSAIPGDGNKYEVVHGELLVTPAPRMLHQLVVGRLMYDLASYLKVHHVGEVFPGGDVQFADDSLVIPDLLLIDLASARTLKWSEISLPLLVVEVLSPSSTRQDRFTKRRLYQEYVVPLYWLVDADAGLVEVWTPEMQFPVTEQAEIRWHPAGAAEPLVIQLTELFRTP